MLRKTFSRYFSTSVKNMAIIGAGQMGTGIGIVGSRTAGLNINFIDQNEAGLKRCENFISNWCAKEMAKDRMK
jgi:3-hydroxybutyryl-CoA dehydrogenase